jgi:hypothetical protein
MGGGSFEVKGRWFLDRNPTTTFIAADLNGDGWVDLADHTDGYILTFLGQGTGRFSSGKTFWSQGGVDSLAAADIDGDGKVDLIGAQPDTGKGVLIFPNPGEGDFNDFIALPVSGNLRDIEIADLDRDGVLDIVAVCYAYTSSPGSVSIIRNEGDRKFEEGRVIFTGGSPVEVKTVDLDSDGSLDIVLGNVKQKSVSILFREVDGGVGSPVEISLASSIIEGPKLIAVADLDGNGDPEVAAVVKDGGNFFLLGNSGYRRLSISATHDLGFSIPAIVVGDFEGDDKVDFAVSRTTSTRGTVAFLRNRGGGLVAAQRYSTGDKIRMVAAADLDGDAGTDLVTADGVGLVLFKNPGDGKLVEEDNIWGQGAVFVVPVDFDGDGDPDLLTANSFRPSLWMFENNGRGKFDSPVEVATVQSPELLAAGDLDADGTTDLVVGKTGERGIEVLRTIDGKGTLIYRHDLVDTPTWIALGDLEGDGFLDIVASTSANTVGPKETLVFHNGGGGVLEDPTAIPSGAQAAFVCDLNGDGRPEIALSSGVLLYNGGDGSFPDQGTVPGVTFAPHITGADFDRDGSTDLVFANYGSDEVLVMMNSKDGSFAERHGFASGYGPYFVTAPDLDTDGLPDIVVVHKRIDRFMVLLNRSTLSEIEDCNGNSVIDTVDIARGTSKDCNGNEIPDSCDIASGTSKDAKGGAADGIPDECQPTLFHRGDANGDGIVDVSDGICVLFTLFLSGGCPGPAGGGSIENCLDAADANDDGALDCSDPIFLLGWLFLGTTPPPFPGPPPAQCGPDTDGPGTPGDLGCETYSRCG